jgi:hypothetical protein
MKLFGRRGAGIVAIGVTAALVACAQGGAVNDPGFESAGSGGYGGAGGQGGEGATTSTGATTTTTDSTTTSTTDTGAGGAGQGGSGLGGSGQGGAGGGGQGGQGGGVPPCDFSAPNTCNSSDEIPSVDGDQNNDTRLKQGIGSKWFRILVKEAVSSIISYPALSFTATLTSPPDTKYDLYVYQGDSSSIDCGVQPAKASGVPESYSQKWNDQIAKDDSTWFVLEVRYVSGSDCEPGSEWQLEVQGHSEP